MIQLRVKDDTFIKLFQIRVKDDTYEQVGNSINRMSALVQSLAFRSVVTALLVIAFFMFIFAEVYHRKPQN